HRVITMSNQTWAVVIRVLLYDLVEAKAQLLEQLGHISNAPHDCTFDGHHGKITFHIDAPSRLEAYQQAAQLLTRLRNQFEPLEATARLTAIRAACDHLNIPLQGPSVGGPLLSFSSGDASAADARAAGQVDIRTFKQQKAPSSANEMACVLAYYLQHLAPADE